MQVSFDIYNKDAVDRLREENPDILPTYSVDSDADLAYNKSQINGAIESAIIQGKSIDHISDDLQKRMESVNRSSAIRTARTATTCAQNAGNLDSFYKAQEMGIATEKQWVCTQDDRTRESHLELDGEHVPLDEEFSNGLQYPGDPSGDPSEVYNCRCTMVAYFPETDSSTAEEEESEEEYEEWYEEEREEEYEEWYEEEPEEENEEGYGSELLTTDETIEKAREIYESGVCDDALEKYDQDGGQALRAATNKSIGFDALPTVVSAKEFSKASDGKNILYRGLKDSDSVTAAECKRQYLYSDLWTGNSGGAVYGNGTYFGGDRSIADSYGTGSTIKAVIKDGANIVDYETIYSEYLEASKVLKNKGLEESQAENASKIMGLGSDDVGSYAKIKGYDAIYVQECDYYVILNRGALIVEK